MLLFLLLLLLLCVVVVVGGVNCRGYRSERNKGLNTNCGEKKGDVVCQNTEMYIKKYTHDRKKYFWTQKSIFGEKKGEEMRYGD